MIDPTAFRFSGYQAAAFYTNLQLSVAKVLPALLGELADTLGGDPTSLPLPAEAPPELPRLLLSNVDKSLRMDVALSRVDIRWQLTAGGQQLSITDFCAFAERALAVFQASVSANAGRVALIAHRFMPDENPGLLLAAHFCRPELLVREPRYKGPLSRPENFELHSHKTYSLGRFPLNSWVRCKTATLSVGGAAGQRVVFVEQDLNTLAEAQEKLSFSTADIREFYALAVPEIEAIARLYLGPRTPERAATR